MKSLIHSVAYADNYTPEYILQSLNNHFHGVEENKHTFLEVIYRSETFVIARMGVDVYAVVVNSLKMFFSSLNGVSDAIYNYEK